MRALFGSVASVVVVTAGASCSVLLPSYPNKVVTCDPAGEPCPTGMTCLDVNADGQPVCTQIGCGDGVVVSTAGDREECDDANENEIDLCSSCKLARFTPTPVGGLGPGGGKPQAIALGQPSCVATDRAGNIFLGAFGANVVMRLDETAGVLTTVAGDGSLVSFDASAGALPSNEIGAAITTGLAVDGNDNVYIVDFFNEVIRRVDAVTGLTTVVVASRGQQNAIGTATQPTATDARVVSAAVDPDGVLYFVDAEADPLIGAEGHNGTDRVRRVDPDTGVMTTVLSGEITHDDGPSGTPLDGSLHSLGLGGIAFDDDGTLYALGDGEAAGVLLVAPHGARDRFQMVDVASTHCPRVSSIDPQKHIAVTPDGKRLFYGTNAGDPVAPDFNKPPCPSGSHECGILVEMDLAGSGVARSASCVVVGELPAAEVVSGQAIGVGSPVVSTTPLDIALQLGSGKGTLLAADPTNNVVWSVNLDDVNAAPSSFIGVSGAGSDFAENIAVGLALETDAHVQLTETNACADVRDPSKGRVQRSNFELLVPFPDQHLVAEVSCDDRIFIVAGDGRPGDGRDEDDLGGPAHEPLLAHLSEPVGASRGKDGNLYIVDRGANAIRKIDLAAGTGALSTLAIDAPLTRPGGLVIDDSGHLLVSDAPADGGGRIYSIDPATGAATDVGIDDLDEPTGMVFVPYEFASFFRALAPSCVIGLDGVAAEPCGMLVVADRSAHRVRGFSLAPIVGYSFDLGGSANGPGDADSQNGDHGQLRFPRGVMVDVPKIDDSGAIQSLSLLVMDDVHRLRRITFGTPTIAPPSLATTLSTITAVDATGLGFPSSDDGADRTQVMRGPSGIAFLDANRALVVEQVTGRLRLFDLAAQSMTTVSGLSGGIDVDHTGSASASEAAPLLQPTSLALDRKRGVAYVAESKGAAIRRFTLTSVADPSSWKSDALAIPSSVSLPAPTGVTVDEETGDLYVADSVAHVVARISADGANGAYVAGRVGQRGFLGDGGRATDASLNAPAGVLFTTTSDGKRFLFIADTGNERVRRVDLATHTITTVLGDGSSDSGGEGGPASSFPVFEPRGLAVDRKANLFVTSGSAVRMVQADTFAPGSEPHVADGNDAVATIYGGPADRGFPASVTHCLAALAVPPGQTAGSRLVAVDSCLGIAITLDRDTKQE